MVQEKQLTVIQEQFIPIQAKVEALQIVDSVTLAEATEYLSQANKYLDTLTADKESITKPLNRALKEIRAKYKPIEEALESSISVIRGKMTRYQTEATKARLEAELALAERVKPGSGNLSLDSALAKIEELETPEKKVFTENGSLTFIETKKFEVIDISLLPLDYHIADEVGIRKAMKEGLELPGVKYWTEQVPRNNR